MKIGITAQINLELLDSFQMVKAEFPKSILNICYQHQVLPFILPITQSTKNIIQILQTVDGVIITGGGDVCTDIYGAKSIQYHHIKSMPKYYRPRDLFEIKMIRLAVRMKKPILGLCRGIQIINVALGGTLYQDINTQLKNRPHPVQHFQHVNSNLTTHAVYIKSGSMLYNILGPKQQVNSYHHQAVKDLGHHLRVVARAPDNIIEGIESKDKLLQGVQWHPEQLISSNRIQEKIFTSFFNRAYQLHNYNKRRESII